MTAFTQTKRVTGSRMKGMSVRRGFIAALFALLFVVPNVGSTPAEANPNPLVCVTLSYHYLNGSTHYVLNDWCALSGGTAWGGSGPACLLDPQIADICWTVVVYRPI